MTVTHTATLAMRSGPACILLLLFLLVLALVPCSSIVQQSSSSLPFTPPFTTPPLPLLAPLLSAPRPILSLDSATNTTRYRYIVVLAPYLTPANLSGLISAILPFNASVHKLLIGPPPPPSFGSSATAAFNAFSAYLTAAQLAAVRASPLVAYVEQDGLISLDLDIDLVDTELVNDSAGGRQVSIGQVGDSNPLYSWGLDRIVSTQHSPPSQVTRA